MHYILHFLKTTLLIRLMWLYGHQKMLLSMPIKKHPYKENDVSLSSLYGCFIVKPTFRQLQF